MADFDPDEFLRSRKASPDTFDPDKFLASRTYAEEREPRNTAWIDIPGVGRAAKGAAKTITGLGVGAGQILSDWDASGRLGQLGATAPAQAIKRWSMSPASSVAEEVGGVLPYFSPMGLERLAATAAGRGAIGGTVLGGLTPTESGSLESHALDAVAGGAGGALLGSSGGYIPKMRHYWHLMHLVPGFGTLAWLAMAAARRAANTRPVSAARRAVAGAAPAESATAVRKAREDEE